MFRTEHETATSGGAFRGLVYMKDHWKHKPNWQIHDSANEVEWFGFRALPVLEQSNLQILLVPLPGHTRGHCGVAVGDSGCWILHCGDAIALNALKTKPGSISARPLGPNFPKLHRLAIQHAEAVRVMPAHVRTNEIPVLAG